MRAERHGSRRLSRPTRGRGRSNRAVRTVPDWKLYWGPSDRMRHCRPPKFDQRSVRLLPSYTPEINLDQNAGYPTSPAFARREWAW